MNSPGTQLEASDRPRAATLKFTYPSGSRPLEGYTIKRGVGRGGFGEVYFATSDAGKEVALKLIRRNLEVELRGVTQCLNLKHPNLIALYDIRTDEMGDQWVIMEYVSGESLEDAIDRHPDGMPVEEVLWWMHGMCAGVAYLHDHGIVHRDLKPGNIFCDEGTVKIGDYGLAKFISCSRRSGQTESVGTVHYMAPEIANGRYGREIDTYALGIILFEMLSGRVPFEGESVGEVLMKHLTAEPDLTALDEPYRDIVRRALAKDPSVRINSVAEMVALLPGSEGAAWTPAAAPAGEPNPRPAAAQSAQPASADYFQVAHERCRNAAGADAGANRGEKQARRNNSQAEATIEEPIWKAVRSGGDYVRRRWHGDGVPPLSLIQKALLALVIVLALLWGFDQAFSIGLQLAIVYVVYYIIWASFIKPGAVRREAAHAHAPAARVADAGDRRKQPTAVWPDDSPGPHGVVRKPTRPTPPPRRPSWRDRVNGELAAKPFRTKLSELLGSMLMAAVFAALAASIVPLLMGELTASEGLAMYMWVALMGTLGSWAIMVPAKVVEGRLEDHVPIRLTLILCGAVLGAAAWYLSVALLLGIPSWGDPVNIREGLVSNEMLRWPRSNDPAKISPAYFLAYFAFLFLVPRWWRQTEYTRSARISFWCVTMCVGWAWLLQFFWWFPQPAGMMVAGVIATATQLASPWMPPSRRRAVAAEIEGGVA